MTAAAASRHKWKKPDISLTWLGAQETTFSEEGDGRKVIDGGRAGVLCSYFFQIETVSPGGREKEGGDTSLKKQKQKKS